MAVRHFVYSFDPAAFTAELRTCVAPDGRLNLEALHACAQAALENLSDAAREALVAVRYSDSWIAADDDEADLPEKWLVIALTRYLATAPSLSLQKPPAYVILKALLPGAGMAAADIQRLVHGDDPASILSDAGIVLPGEESGALRDLGGWMSPASIDSLSRELERVRDCFVDVTPDRRAALADRYSGWGVDADKHCRQAYAAAQEMLDDARRRDRALFMVLD